MLKRKHIIILITVIMLILVARAALATWRVWQFMQAVDHLNAVLEDDDSTSIEAAVRDVLEKGGRAAGDAALVSPLFPIAGDAGCVLKDAVYVADELLPVAEELTPLVDPLYLAAKERPGPRQIEIGAVRQAWTEAAPDVEQFAATLERIQDGRVVCPGATGRYRKLADATDSMLFLLDIAVHVPWDDALADSSRWLILLNNSDEIRATGGFTTAFFDIYVDDGVLHWAIKNTYVVDNLDTMRYHPRAPLPQYTYMEPMRWWFRDANWSPDHPTSANLAMRFYALDQGTEMPVGVITVNFSAIDTLVDFIPPIWVRGQPFNKETALDLIRTEWGADAGLPSRDPNKKNFLLDYSADLSNALAHQLGRSEQARLGLALEEMLQQRDVMVYTTIEPLSAYVTEKGWTGELIDVEGDYFFPLDSNLGYNKVTPYVERSYVYAVDLQDPTSPAAHVEMQYTNTRTEDFGCTYFNNAISDVPSYYDRTYSCFWDYARILFPMGSTIESYEVHEAPSTWFQFTNAANPAHIDALTEDPYAGVGTMLVVPINDSRTLTFDYTLPEHVVAQHQNEYTYTLYVQNQAGSIVDPHLTIQIVLPPDADIVAIPDAAQREGRTITLEQDLRYDLSITLRWRDGRTGD